MGRASLNEPDWPLKYDAAFSDIWQQVAPYTMTSPQRGYALWQAVNHVIDQNIPGAFVECGVWKGGSSMLMALALMARGAKRNLFLFDTFDGMTSPTAVDKDLHGNSASQLLDGHHGARLAELVTARATLQDVRQAIAKTGYDWRCIYLIPGDVRTTLPKTQTLDIALMRLDTDFYNSTYAELSHLYPRVRKGGIVIIDDYGHWQGAREAVDDYFSNEARAEKPMLWALDYTGRGFTKVEPTGKIEIERYDYLPPGMINPSLLGLFPTAQPFNAWSVKWPYLRASVPHIFRVDTREKKGSVTGNASFEEAICLHNIALQFSGKRGLEIGTHFGWTGVHLRAAGLEMDFVDPVFGHPDRLTAIEEVMDSVDASQCYRLWPLYSPEGISDAITASSEKWSFVFIDGNHDGNAPENDALAVANHCAEDAVVMFHDMTSPDVARGLSVFQHAGWNVGLLNTMQVLGVAWRGRAQIPEHIMDPSMPRLFHAHLQPFTILSCEG